MEKLGATEQAIGVTDHAIERFLKRFPEYTVEDLTQIRDTIRDKGCSLEKYAGKGCFEGILKYKNQMLHIIYAARDRALVSIWRERTSAVGSDEVKALRKRQFRKKKFDYD